MKDFIKEINFDQLKEQKKDLIQVVTYLEKQGLKKMSGSLEGILNLIDKVQDIAVDKLGYDEKEVFDLESEEEANSK